MAKKHPIPDAQVAAFLKHYKWLLAGKPRERLAYRIIERQREEIARLRTELDTLRAADGQTWAERVSADR
ncbi:hypothetical protein GobsT_14140 [Gemmata obscuriglobus]|uniref:Uncharacterized protein n=1 Tax=Gemmata obscuriglobus TaxID=114 RepID=A0A2Z3HEJ3_9BACT|nr:hypothetical protein [Gemmata obscuriglobus]AWM40154.1 hypothetical protein C1280_26210 [Gemmata obscuriglobus]QEG26669.1 hypothetical protein GobsT_14140 [Gemmata obscuriglobus]VTS02296.1 unnamed protein product [Gemmata obscuriglobus UQM 2246]